MRIMRIFDWMSLHSFARTENVVGVFLADKNFRVLKNET